MKPTVLTPTRSMSSRRQAVLAAVRQHFRDTGCSPSYAEIGARIGLEPRHVRPHLVQLQEDGLLTFRQGVGRSIALVDRTANLSDDELEAAAHQRGWQVVRSALPQLAAAIPVEVLAPLPERAAALLAQLDNAAPS